MRRGYLHGEQSVAQPLWVEDPCGGEASLSHRWTGRCWGVGGPFGVIGPAHTQTMGGSASWLGPGLLASLGESQPLPPHSHLAPPSSLIWFLPL